MSLIELHDYYDKHPALKGLVQLIPYASAVDTAISTALENLKAKKIKTFFKELEESKFEIDENAIKNEEFLHKFFITYNAFSRTNNHKKIRLFARLFRSSVIDEDDIADPDNYEEMIQILERLQPRDLLLLIIFEREIQQHNLSLTDHKDGFTTRFGKISHASQELIMAQLSLSYGELLGCLNKLSGLGLWESFQGTLMDAVLLNGRPSLKYLALQSAVKAKEEELI